MRKLLMIAMFLNLFACVQDEGKIDSGSVSADDGTTGSTSGGSSGGSAPTDPLYAYQWHLHNSGQSLGTYNKVPLLSGIDINADEAHELWRGEGVKIVISDSGTDYFHPDLSTNFISADQRDYSNVEPSRWDDDSADAYPSGDDAHGTAVAGIAAMSGWNDIGGRGVAPSAQYTAFKYVLSYSAMDHLASNEDKEIHQLNADYDVFNFSYGITQCAFVDNFDEDIKDQYEFGVTNLRGGDGAIYVQAAGNSFAGAPCSDLADFPVHFGNTNATASLSYPEKIITAAVNGLGVKASYSTPGSGVWISGLGGEGTSDIDDDLTTPDEYAPAIFTSDIQDCSSGYSYRSFFLKIKNPFNYAFDTTLNRLCDYTNEMNGTSSATPMVSGVVALMLEAKPGLSWREVKYILATSSRKVDFADPIVGNTRGPLTHPMGTLYENDVMDPMDDYVYDYKWTENNAGHWFSNWYGFGLVDAEEAVRTAAAWIPNSLGIYSVTTHDYTGPAVPIPENNDMLTPASAVINVAASVSIEAIEVKVTMDHEIPEQLAIHLVSPAGTVSRLVLVDSGITSGGSTEYYFQTNAFLDELSDFGTGNWTLQVYDPKDIPTIDIPLISGYQREDTGDLLDWSMTIHGH